MNGMQTKPNMRNQTISNNGAHILGDNYRDYKRYLEIEKMNTNSQFQKPPTPMQTIQSDGFQQQRTPFNYASMKRSETPNQPSHQPTPLARPYSQTALNGQMQLSNDDVYNEIKQIKAMLAKSFDNQNEMQSKIIEYNKIISEQENIIRLNNIKLNEHDNKLTEILLSFNNYLQLNDKSTTIINEVQKRIDACIGREEYNDLKSTVYNLNKGNESKINEIYHTCDEIKMNFAEMSKENETYQKFTLEKIKNVQKEAMESRLQQQNDLIKMDESKESRLTAQFNQINNTIALVDKNLKEESDFRKKMVDNLRNDILQIFSKNDEKFQKLEKTQLETEKNLIFLNKDYMTTFNDLISKHNEKYDIELKAIRSIIEAGLTKVDLKLDKDNKAYEENLSAMKASILEQKSHVNEVETFVKESINTIENKLEISKGNNEDYFTKFDLLSTTLTKYMKENLEMINSKTKEVSDSCLKKIAESIDDVSAQIKIRTEENEKHFTDIEEKIKDIVEHGTGGRTEDKIEEMKHDLSKPTDPNVELIREYVDKLFEQKVVPIRESFNAFENKLIGVMNEKVEEVKVKFGLEHKTALEKISDVLEKKIEFINQELEKKQSEHKTLVDGRIQEYVLESENRIKSKYDINIKKIQDDLDNIIVKIGVGV